jgi:phosphoribosylformimino-5-aminoimidazole carboxamide ribotide isomerase
MRILPAVDIRGGLCVNLVQGDYDQETVFSKDPVAQAVEWHGMGASLVHIVDLDGARDGKLRVEPQLRAMAKAGVSFQVGGGIRDRKAIEAVFDAGAERVILGTAAFRDRALLEEAASAHPGRVVVGIDAKAGKVALQGWVDVTDAQAIDFAKEAESAGACRIVYTDILSDGMMKGPNLQTTRELARAIHVPVTASGGVSSLEDIRRLRELQGDGVDEVIVGRALYLGAFTLPQAMAIASGVLD